MNFELKTLSLSDAAAHKCDLLVLLVPDGFKPQADALSVLAARAIKDGDLELKPGKLLPLYGVPGIAARRLVLLGCGKGSAQAVRQAVQALGATLKAPSVRRVALVFARDAEAGCVGAAVRALADASYVYTTTKPKADARALSRVTVGVPGGLETARPEFSTSVALVAGIEYAREWGNRPANHATPTLVGDAAKALAADVSKMVADGGGQAVVDTVGGCKLTAKADGGKVTFTDENGNAATVTIADVIQSNGVIHVIDKVLLPKM